MKTAGAAARIETVGYRRHWPSVAGGDCAWSKHADRTQGYRIWDSRRLRARMSRQPAAGKARARYAIQQRSD